MEDIELKVLVDTSGVLAEGAELQRRIKNLRRGNFDSDLNDELDPYGLQIYSEFAETMLAWLNELLASAGIGDEPN